MKKNLGKKERIVSAVAGAGLAAYAFKQASPTGKILTGVAGGLLGARAATGFCAGKAAVTKVGDTLKEQTIRVEKRFVINAPIENVYEFWNNFENFPKFMTTLDSVVRMSDTRSHWISKAPLGTTVEWDAETTKNVPNDVIAWRSTTGDVPNSGEVRFKRSGPKTRVKVRLEYTPPAGKIGETIAWIFGEDPKSQLESYITKLKEILEGSAYDAEQIRRGNIPELQSA